MSSLDILRDFQRGLIAFMDELIELLPSEADLVVVRIFLADQIPIQDVIQYFIKKILPLKEYVYKKDDNFFLQHNILFELTDKGGIGNGKINHFRRLWLTDLLDGDDRDTMWRWFKFFIQMSEKYQKTLIPVTK
jgi:hypothetical protein